MKLRYRIYRSIIRMKWRYSRNSYDKIVAGVDNIHLLVVDIVSKLLKNKDSALLICPKSNDRYLLQYDQLLSPNTPETFVVIEHGRVLIINHQYYYNLNIEDKVYRYLLSEFDKETERRRRKMKKEIIANVEDSLAIINKKLGI